MQKRYQISENLLFQTLYHACVFDENEFTFIQETKIIIYINENQIHCLITGTFYEFIVYKILLIL